MVIRSLELQNFRNYASLAMEFDEGINILFGDNAQGKTNILEALYLTSTTKSHRASKDREMIRIGQEEAHIRLFLSQNDVDHRMDLHLKQSKAKGAAIDGVPVRRSGDLVGFLKVVFFSPEDLSIIKNGPGERRRFLDMELCQLDKVYLNQLANYNRALNQRNNLLKQIGQDPSLKETLELWEEQLISYGTQIMRGRASFLQELAPIVSEIHAQLSGGKEELKLLYEPNVSADRYREELFYSRDRDIYLKTTHVGPHRDDMVFEINGSDARRFGSQGQQRTAALSLKMAEIEIVRRRTGQKPILLLDDVLSELDRSRQTYLLSGISGTQVIMTCTGLEEFVENRVRVNRVFEVIEGQVMPRSEEETLVKGE
ncbi:MAG: DNA replication/repair protein RecF [Lachnospiraceae bacterium]|nr:DNA replication/repair protein RecF [Lachnospiraceae bacterium]